MIEKDNNIDAIWTPTLNLRYLKKGMGKNVHPSYSKTKITRLQQQWKNISTGELTWKDVPFVEEKE